MDKAQQKRFRRRRSHNRLRKRVQGSAQRPRLAVFKSLRFVYAQIIDDDKGQTLVQASSAEKGIRERLEGGASSEQAARIVGETVAERALEQGIKMVVFDRGGYIYHGKIRQVAEGVRAKGLQV